MTARGRSPSDQEEESPYRLLSPPKTCGKKDRLSHPTIHFFDTAYPCSVLQEAGDCPSGLWAKSGQYVSEQIIRRQFAFFFLFFLRVEQLRLQHWKYLTVIQSKHKKLIIYRYFFFVSVWQHWNTWKSHIVTLKKYIHFIYLSKKYLLLDYIFILFYYYY